MIKIIFFLIAAGGINTFSFAQQNKLLPFTKLEIKDGLPGINVRKITKDRFGFMWFCTQDGISRFDGRSFLTLNSYNVDPKRKTLGTDMYDAKPDLSGNFLWALSAYGGLNQIDLATCNLAGRYQVGQAESDGNTLWYKCFAETSDDIIVGTYDGTASIFSKKEKKVISSINLAEKFGFTGKLEQIFVDNKNQIWFLVSGKGILITDQTCARKIGEIAAEDLFQNNFAFSDFAFFEKYVLITTTSGLITIDMSNRQVLPPKNNPLLDSQIFYGQELHGLAVGDSLAIITGKDIIYCSDLRRHVTNIVQLAGNYEDHRAWTTLINSVYVSGKSFWIGSQPGVGWIRDINSPFSTYFNSFDGSNIKIAHAVTLASVNDSTVFVCGDDGLYSVNTMNATIKKLPGKEYYYSVFPVSDNYYLASAIDRDLQLIDKTFSPTNIRTVFPELNPIVSDLLWCAARLGDSVVLMASQNNHGLYIWNKGSHQLDSINTRTKRLRLQNDNINRLYVDSKKRIWIICENAVSIYDYARNKLEHLSLKDESGKPTSINMDICETKNGFWIASYGTGLIELSSDLHLKKIYGAKDGIQNLGLYKVLRINDSTLLVTSNNGLFTISTANGRIKSYFSADGLQSNSFEEASGDQSGNHIFVGGFGGITKIDIDRFDVKSPRPDLAISGVSFMSDKKRIDTFNIKLSRIKIPQFISQITINFSLLNNYYDPEKTSFLYRIREKDESWSITDKNFIQSFRLSPGTYHLQVKALNEDGVESEIKELTLIFLPKWYQTWWFKTLVALLGAGIVYGLYRMRINQFNKEKKIRSKLASDLHDDLGSTMNSVKVYANLAMMEKQADKYLPLIKDGTQQAIIGIRDIIWVLDDSKDTVEDLFSRINTFAAPLCEANHVQFKSVFSDAVRGHKLAQEERRNLYMILKEAVNNAIKYAEGNQITIEAAIQKGKTIFSIADNGKGFDLQTDSEGNGLRNMQQRAKEIHYEVNIQSAAAQGTKIILRKV